MSFSSAVKQVYLCLAIKDVERARQTLEQAWALAEDDKDARKVAHDLGNKVQGLIFDMYLEGSHS